MYGWMVSKMIRRAVDRMNQGDIAPTLANYSEDAVLVFPGDHSWGGVYDGKARIEGFLRRCVDSGIQFNIEDIVVSGWPWNTRVCVRLSDGARDADGRIVYSNRAVLFVKSRWGKIYYQEDYEDTQAVVQFDRQMGERQLAISN